MSDIDYDELDRAVSDVMGSDEPSSHPAEKPVDPLEAQDDDAVTHAEEVHVRQPKKSVVPVTRPKARGRYMDMVHQRSDMRPVGKIAATVKPVTRPAVRPVQASAGRSVPPKSPLRSVPKPAPEPDEGEVVFGEIEDVVPEKKGRAEIEAEAEFVSEPKPFAANKTDEAAPNADNFALGGKSPFLEAAIVEKRPLGDFVSESSADGVRSTKNVYSQRSVVAKKGDAEPAIPKISPASRKKSGWLYALMVLLVIALGAGAGIGAWWLVTGGL